MIYIIFMLNYYQKIKHNQIVMTTIDKEKMVLDSLKGLNYDFI